jgi:hypothetical protein
MSRELAEQAPVVRQDRMEHRRRIGRREALQEGYGVCPPTVGHALLSGRPRGERVVGMVTAEVSHEVRGILAGPKAQQREHGIDQDVDGRRRGAPAGFSDAASPGLFSRNHVSQTPVDDAEVEPQVNARRIVGYLPAKQGQVPQVLAPLIAFVSEVVDLRGQVHHPRPFFCDEPVDIRRRRLVDDAVEADVGAVAKQAVLQVRGEEVAAPEPDRASHGVRRRQLVTQAVRRPQPLVGVDVEDPLTVGALEGGIASVREASVPRSQRDVRAGRGGHADGPVGGAGVEHHDFVDDAGDGRDAAREVVRLVLDDDRRRQEHATTSDVSQ